MALVGVEGSGAGELVASVAGYAPGSGSIEIAGHDGSAVVGRATAYLSADRRGMLFSNLSVGHNLVIRLGIPEIASRGGLLLLRRLAHLGYELVERFRIRANSPEQPLPSLSGGNQQKVAIAAAIARRPAVLALEEPTRGVDVGSKAEIYRILRDFAASGNGVLVYCTEVPEVFELADRLAIMDGGLISKPRKVANFPDVASLAAAIATGERTTVEEGDIRESHAPIALASAEESEPGRPGEADEAGAPRCARPTPAGGSGSTRAGRSPISWPSRPRVRSAWPRSARRRQRRRWPRSRRCREPTSICGRRSARSSSARPSRPTPCSSAVGRPRSS